VGTNICAVAMVVGRIFLTEGPLLDRGAKSGEISFFETKKTTFFDNSFKTQGGLGPLFPPFPTAIAVA